MPYVFNNPDYVRNMEVLYRGNEYTGSPLDPALNTLTTPIIPGMVAVLLNGTVTHADSVLDDGAFKGLFLSEVSSQLDELNNKDLPPVVVTGPGTCKVRNAALDPASTYAVSPTGVVELVVGTGLASGRLKPRGAETGPAVAHLEQVLPDGILIALLPESAGSQE